MKADISQLANVMVKSHKSSEEIAEALLGLGVSPCVARDWANEPKRRAALFERHKARCARKDASKFGGKGDAYRRIIQTETVKPLTFMCTHASVGEDGGRVETEVEHTIPGREFCLHATKGWRSYRIAA